MTLGRFLTVGITATIAALTSRVSLAEIPDRPYWRWFEVEVLLFEQNMNQDIAEQFPLSVTKPPATEKHRLLRRYLTHDYPALRAGLDLCETEILSVSALTPACRFEDEDLWIPIPGNPLAPTDPLKSLPKTPVVIDGSGGDINTAAAPFIMPAETHVLTETRTELANKGLANPLLHIAWRQPVFGEEDDNRVRLFAGKQYTKQFNYDGFLKPQPNAMPPYPADSMTSASDSMSGRMQKIEQLLAIIADGGTPFSEQPSDPRLPTIEAQRASREADPYVWQLDGSIHIFLIGNYLHIDGDFQLRDPVTIELPSDSLQLQAQQALYGAAYEQERSVPFLRAYPFSQRRRVISHETHYFDHPHLGMVVQIRRTDLSARRY